MRKLGVVEQLFTSDGQWFLNDSVPLRPANDVLLTVNFMKDKEAFTNLKRLQVSYIQYIVYSWYNVYNWKYFTGENFHQINISMSH